MRTIATKVDNVGDTWSADAFNTWRDELEIVATSSGYTLDPEAGPDTNKKMLVQSISTYAGAARTYSDSGTANSYVLSLVGTLEPITAYVDGLEVMFIVGNTNTGASTLNAETIGSQSLTLPGGAALTGGELVAGKVAKAIYDLSNTRWELVSVAENNFLDEHTRAGAHGNITATSVTSTGVVAIPDGTAAAPALTNDGDEDNGIYFNAVNEMAFSTGGVYAGNFDSGHNLLLLGTSGGLGYHRFHNSATGDGVKMCEIGSSSVSYTGRFSVYAADIATWNAAATAVTVGSVNSTGRSIGASGTVNASGTDYAEYEFKFSGYSFEIAAGDIVGFDPDGLLVDKWSLAVTYGIKSTKPSFVGGDVWGTENITGAQPVKPVLTLPLYEGDKNDEEAVDAYNATILQMTGDYETALEEYVTALADFEAKLEVERQKVDRIAYSGKVPCNLLGGVPGDFLIPIEGPDDTIAGVYAAAPTLEQLYNCIGRVKSVSTDGRPIVAVRGY